MPLIIILLFIPSILGQCPPILSNIDNRLADFTPIISEALETACDRRNFTVAFWNADLIKEMLRHEKTDSNHFLRPVIEFLRNEIHSRHNAELEAYNYHGYSRTPLSPSAQANLTQATKASFGFVETTEMKRNRIETAAKAYSRFVEKYRKEGGPNLEKQMALVFDLMLEQSSFKNFTEHFDPALMGTGITPLEVIPAIETLYVQFRSLTDRMAHSNVIVFLMLLSKIPSNTPPPMGGFGYLPHGMSLAQAHYRFNSDETKAALNTTFPEMIAYLKENHLL